MDDYRIVSSQNLNNQFAELCAQADAHGRGQAVLDAAEEIMLRIQADPLSVGEPEYDLKHMKLQMRHVVNSCWSFHFGVDEARRIVYIT